MCAFHQGPLVLLLGLHYYIKRKQTRTLSSWRIPRDSWGDTGYAKAVLIRGCDLIFVSFQGLPCLLLNK